VASHDGSNRSGANQIWKSPVSGGRPHQITQNGGLEAFESPDGKTLFYTKGSWYTPGLWCMPVQGGWEVPIPQLSPVLPGHWTVADRGICFVDVTDAQPPTRDSGSGATPNKPVPVKLFDFRERRVHTVGAIERLELSGRNSFTVTRDGRWMAWRQTDRCESNLMLIDDFR
jgi:hypothetical protein